MNNVDEEDFELAVSSMTRELQAMMTAGQAPTDAREEIKRQLSRQFGRLDLEKGRGDRHSRISDWNPERTGGGRQKIPL